MSIPKVTSYFKCSNLLDNLNIKCISPNRIFMWNKYQIFIYEGSFESPTKVFTPEYLIHRLLITDDHFLCLDTDGFVHVTELNQTLDRQTLPHQPRDQDIKAFEIYGENECMSLKYESDTYFLCINKINSRFRQIKKFKIYTHGPWPLQDGTKDKYIIAHKKVNELYRKLFLKMFDIDALTTDSHFTVISFDKHTVYGCLCDVNNVEDSINLFKIYGCPSEICSIEMIDTESTYIIIGLKMGTVVRLTLNDLYSCASVIPTSIQPEVLHLNSSLHKYLITGNTIMYTDGATMWHADLIFAKNTKFRQYYVKNVNDFTLQENNIICTTFTKMIYTFPSDPEKSCYKPEQKLYSPAAELLTNADYLFEIFSVVEKSKKLAKELIIEGSYIAAMSLAEKHEIVNRVISVSVTVYDNFEEVLKESGEKLTLPESMSQYLESSVYLFRIKIKMEKDIPGGLYDIVSEIMTFSETEIHVTLSNDTKILKTISVDVSKMHLLIPVHLDNDTDINVVVRIVARIPGTYNKKQKIWTEIFRKEIKMSAEHFINAKYETSQFNLRERTQDYDKAIIKCAKISEHQFKVVDMSLAHKRAHIMYIRLPKTFSADDFGEYFTKIKSKYVREMLSNEDFLMSNRKVGFLLGRQSVTVALVNDGFSTPCLKIMSGNLKVTASIRNFLFNIIYENYVCSPGMDFVKLSFYTSVENLQKAVKNCIKTKASYKEFAPLQEKFEREIIGSLPV